MATKNEEAKVEKPSVTEEVPKAREDQMHELAEDIVKLIFKKNKVFDPKLSRNEVELILSDVLH